MHFTDPGFLRQCTQLLTGMGLPNRVQAGVTNRADHTAYRDRSFAHRYSSMDAKLFKPGSYVDYAFNKDGHTYFVSMFFDAKNRMTEYRLVRLPEVLTEPFNSDTLDAVYQGDGESDVVLDEGQPTWEQVEPKQLFERLQTWLRTLM